MKLHLQLRLIFLALFGLAVTLFYHFVIQDVLFQGILKILWKRLTEKVLPPQTIKWLNENHINDVWKNLHLTEDFEQRPNILLIVADDLGVNDVSGGSGIATPFIDSIAKNGLNFTQAYSAQATCAPSRAALFTGRYPTGIGMEFTPIPRFFARFMADRRPADAPQPIYHHELYDQVPEMFALHIPKEIPVLGEVFREFGYQNYFLGKWDGSFREDENSPLHRGYDETLAILMGSSLYASTDDPRIVSSNNISVDQFMKRMLSYKIQFNNGAAFRPSEYLTDYLGTESSRLIHELSQKRKERELQSFSSRDDPWFITVAFTAPHNPFQALKSDYEHPDIQKIPTLIGRIYAAMILALDRNVGRMIQALRDTNQYDNTLIIFTSDNGAAPYVGLSDLNAPYRGWKGTLFEGGIRIPFFLQWPKKILVPSVVNSMIIHLDIFPTLLNLVTNGIKAIDSIWLKHTQRNSLFFSGTDILGPVLNKTQVKKIEGLNITFESYTTSSHSTVTPLHSDFSRVFYWRSGSYKAVRYYHYKLQVHSYLNKLWFYNLLDDASERNNLLDSLSATFSVASITETQLQAWIKDSSLFPANLSQSRIGETVDEHKVKTTFEALSFVYQQLQQIDASQSPPLWPALVELPICIDKPQVPDDICTLSDEYIIWAN